MRVRAEVQPDFLEKIATTRNPILAIGELIWNGLDADATRVDVHVVRNSMNGIEEIRVVDNGHGMGHAEALQVFKKLGNSWKKATKRSQQKRRILHGQDGQGRYKAFALGDRVTWRSVHDDGNDRRAIQITGQRPSLTDFEVSDPVVEVEHPPGTEVVISAISRPLAALDDARRVASELAIRFALYLREYSDVKIIFDNETVDHRQFEEHFAEYPLEPVVFQDGNSYPARLSVIEWSIPVERALYFCDDQGFALERRAVGIHAPEFTFTAYIASSGVRQLENRAAFAWEDGHPDLDAMSDAARSALKAHFLSRKAQLAEGLIEEWKAERVYPFEGEATSPVEQVERQVFNVVAKNVRDHLPNFDESDTKSKRFSLHLLRRAIESSPDAVQRIIKEVLELPEEKASDLAELLERTTLAAVINASKIVADRLRFIAGLKVLLFDAESKKALKERSQLQKIIEDETWIFGEQFALSVADQDLHAVLEKHIEKLGREPGADFEEQVVRADGKKGIVDVMLSRRIPQSQDNQLEHLIVELKRPSQKINAKIIHQIRSYALAVAEDERFTSTNTKWEFWVVSNDVVAEEKRLLKQKDRPFGLIHDDPELDLRVWAVPWSRILDACRARMEFYKRARELEVTDDDAVAYLRRVHEKYLPAVLRAVG